MDAEWKGQIEQLVSINSFMDIEIDGESVRVQVTSRHMVKAEKIADDVEEHIKAYQMVRGQHPAPKAAQLPEQPTIQVRDENGTPVVDTEGNPKTVPLPEGVKMYTVAAAYHDKNKDGTKDLFKVLTVEKPHNGKYGVTCFHPHEIFNGWKTWPVGERRTPPNTMYVLIREPSGDEKYSEILEFRS